MDETNTGQENTEERDAYRGSLGESSPRPPVHTAAWHPREGGRGREERGLLGFITRLGQQAYKLFPNVNSWSSYLFHCIWKSKTSLLNANENKPQGFKHWLLILNVTFIDAGKRPALLQCNYAMLGQRSGTSFKSRAPGSILPCNFCTFWVSDKTSSWADRDSSTWLTWLTWLTKPTF